MRAIVKYTRIVPLCFNSPAHVRCVTKNSGSVNIRMNPMSSRRIDGSSFSLRVAVSIPATRTLPEVDRRMQPMIESNVVLPLPEGPMSSTTSPGKTSRSTP
jgi:hypothetical protein